MLALVGLTATVGKAFTVTVCLFEFNVTVVYDRLLSYSEISQ